MTTSWRAIQRQNFTNVKKFLDFVGIDLAPARTEFPLNVPKRLAEKMKKGDLSDPLFLQFFPFLEEEKKSPFFILDPVQDRPSQKTKKLLHKYQGRALLLCSSACAMHCRYCFRQHFPYETEIKSFDEELHYLKEDPSIEEVILSGGDPLSLSDAVLGDLLNQIDKIPHVKRIRFHTRFPIGIPERIDASFLSLLEKTRCQSIFVIHINHPKEWDIDIQNALYKIQALKIPVLSQTVLLKGINDSEAVLFSLFSLLANHGILPYYLHQLDQVEGAAHFEVPIEKGLMLMEALRTRLSGYALPRYVQEIGGKPSKTEISNAMASRCEPLHIL